MKLQALRSADRNLSISIVGQARHVSKSLKNKLLNRVKNILGNYPWIKSILNRFWQCCDTFSQNIDMLQDMKISMLCHIRNKHSWKGKKSAHSNICDHSNISSKSRNYVKWFQVHSESFYAVEKIVLNKSLLKVFIIWQSSTSILARQRYFTHSSIKVTQKGYISTIWA